MTLRPSAVWSSAASHLRALGPRRDTFKADAVAGLPGAISSVPDGMASGVLAGVSPVAGLYASFAGPIAGGFTSSTRRMMITTTSAAALAAGSAISSVAAEDRDNALILLTMLAGVFMAIAGLARLGRYTRFVSHSVMLGFLTGIAVNIICGQLGDFTGAPATGGSSIEKAVWVVVHPGEIEWASVAVGVAAMGILVALARTKLAVISTLIALIVPTAVVLLVGADVARVDDGGDIPAGLPLPTWPHLGLLNGPLIVGAAAVAAIVLVQGAGVAEAAPNATGPSDANRDFVAQGAGNVASAMFRGMPVGGSVGQTALNISAGAKTRWASIMSGVWMIIILLAFSSAVGAVSMPTLAAILIFAAVGSIRPSDVGTIWRAGPNSKIALVGTFAATLLFPVPAAVGLGVVVSLLLQLNQEVIDLLVVERVRGADGHESEHPAPQSLRSNAVTVLIVYGSLFHAGSRTLQAQLPDPTGSQHPAVVLRLRGRTTLGATFFIVAAEYAKQLRAVGGRLYLSGVDPEMADRLKDIDLTGRLDTVRLYPATDEVGEATGDAVLDAETWLVEVAPPTVDASGPTATDH